MERNGKNLCSCMGNSRHINIQYLFVKNRIEKGEVKIKYCPTHLMITDLFTKPLVAAQFECLKSFIMGYVSIEEFQSELAAHLQKHYFFIRDVIKLMAV